jgi:hypothetical protein
VTHTRSTDPLLAYMHHARNVDEHALEPVADPQGGKAVVTIPSGKPFSVDLTIDSGGQIGVSSNSPWIQVVDDKPAGVRLCVVRDRSVTYAVPACHLGQPIIAPSLYTLARL